MAGPCSAETEEQIMNTAIPLADMGIKIFRAGIWKPRTRPNAFEGVGSVGLRWLQRVKKETGMLVSTEVANVKHVYEALKYGVDILWIGARTSASDCNKMTVQPVMRNFGFKKMVQRLARCFSSSSVTSNRSDFEAVMAAIARWFVAIRPGNELNRTFLDSSSTQTLTPGGRVFS